MNDPLHAVVCLKATPCPDTVAELAANGQLRLDESGRALRLAHVPHGIYGFDEQALGTVVELARSAVHAGGVQGGGAWRTTAVSVAPADPDVVFRRAFELGVEDGLLVTVGVDGSGGGHAAGGASGARGVAPLLSAAVRSLGADLVVMGASSCDGGSGTVGPTVAALLGLPCVAAARALQVDGRRLRALRSTGDAGGETVEVDLPAVVTVLDDGWEPVQPRAADILAARGRTVTRWEPTDGTVPPAVGRTAMTVDRAANRGELLDGDPAAVAAALLDRIGGVR